MRYYQETLRVCRFRITFVFFKGWFFKKFRSRSRRRWGSVMERVREKSGRVHSSCRRSVIWVARGGWRVEWVSNSREWWRCWSGMGEWVDNDWSRGGGERCWSDWRIGVVCGWRRCDEEGGDWSLDRDRSDKWWVRWVW